MPQPSQPVTPQDTYRIWEQISQLDKDSAKTREMLAVHLAECAMRGKSMAKQLSVIMGMGAALLIGMFAGPEKMLELLGKIFVH